MRFQRWQAAATLLGHLDRMYDEYGWTPLDQREASVAGIRATLAAEGVTVFTPRTNSAALGRDIVAEMAAVAREARGTG